MKVLEEYERLVPQVFGAALLSNVAIVPAADCGYLLDRWRHKREWRQWLTAAQCTWHDNTLNLCAMLLKIKNNMHSLCQLGHWIHQVNEIYNIFSLHFEEQYIKLFNKIAVYWKIKEAVISWDRIVFESEYFNTEN